MIFANSATRRLTDAELSRQAERIELLLYQLKEEGYEFPGRMRDQVAAACQVSAPKLARLKVIREHLISSYMALFEKNQLPEQTACTGPTAGGFPAPPVHCPDGAAQRDAGGRDSTKVQCRLALGA